MLPPAFFLLFCLTVIRADDQASSDDRQSEAEKIVSSLKKQMASETGSSLLRSGDLDLVKDTDMLMKYVRQQYKNLAYTLEDNSNSDKYIESLVKNFFLDFCVSYDSQYMATYHAAANRTDNKGSLTAVQLAAPVRQYYDYIMNFINTPLTAVQQMCSVSDKNRECHSKLYSAMSKEAETCKDVWSRVVIFETVLNFYKDLQKQPNQITVEELKKEFLNTIVGPTVTNNHYFNSFVSKLNDNTFRGRLSMDSRTDLYKVIAKTQNDGKLTCLSSNV